MEIDESDTSKIIYTSVVSCEESHREKACLNKAMKNDAEKPTERKR